MIWIYLYIAGLIITGLGSLFVAYFARHRRSTAGSRELAVLMLLVATWSLALAGEMIAQTRTTKIIWTILSYPGNQIVPAMFLIFVLRYTQRDKWLNREGIAALLVIPCLSVLFAATSFWHNFLWAEITLKNVNGWVIGQYAHGTWYWVEVAYSYLAVAAAIALLVWNILRYRGLYSLQTRVVLVSSLFPFVVNVLYAFNPGAIAGVDLTSIGFFATGGLLAWAIFRYNLLDVAPIARDLLVEIIREGVLVLDAQNRLVDCNPAGQQMFNWKNFPVGEPAEQVWKDYPQILELCRAGESKPAELVIENRTYQINASLLRNREGRVAGRILLALDLTEHIKDEERMRLQATALEAARNGIVITDANGRIEWANPAFSTLTGFEFSEVVGQSTKIFNSGKQTETFYKGMWKTIQAGDVWQGSLINRRKDGTLYYEEMTITPMTQSDGKISHYIAIKQDISARREAEAAMQKAHDQALEANRMKTQLLANVSHDLRTPLGAIIGYAEMLEMGVFGDASPEQQNAASEILDSANQLMTFVNNMIGQAQIETGRIKLIMREFDPRSVIEPIQSITRFHANKRKLDISYEIDPQLPKTLVGDPYWLRQILINLTNNAIKFTDEGGVKCRLYLVDQTHWAMQVSDTGIGIPKKFHGSIFQPFRQVDSSMTRRQVGSGLGLSIVKELTNNMNGKIELDSSPGQGTTITIVLPLIPPEEKKK